MAKQLFHGVFEWDSTDDNTAPDAALLGAKGLARTHALGDQVPTDLILKGGDAWSGASTNTTGADVELRSGIGSRYITVVDYSLLDDGADTFVLTIDGTATTLTAETTAADVSAIKFFAGTSNAVTAADIARCVRLISGIESAVVDGARVSIQTKPEVRTFTLTTTADAGEATTTSGTDGNVNLKAVTMALTGNQTVSGTLGVTGATTLTTLNMSLGSDAAGDMFYKSTAAAVARLAKGTAGQLLRQNSGLTAPEWVSLKTSWTVHFPGVSGVDTDFAGGFIAGCDLTLDLTQTEAAAAYSVVYDATNDEYVPLATSSSGTGITANYQIVPDTVADNDAWYMGHTAPFPEVYIDMDTALTYTGDAVTWEYYNGSVWSALTIIKDVTGGATTTGTRPFQQDGVIYFLPPTDWASTIINSQAAYWIRARVSTVANHGGEDGTTNSVEHKVASPATGLRAPYGGTITDLAIADYAGTIHTATDIKFVLFNFTTGAATAALTFAQDRRRQRFTGLTLAVAENDILGVLVTQEDGTNEMGPFILEADVTLA